MSISKFQVGQIYFGSLSCAHGSFPVRCIKRTAKMVQFEHATLSDHYAIKRSKIRPIDLPHKSYEAAYFHGWYIGSDSVTDNGWDMRFA